MKELQPGNRALHLPPGLYDRLVTEEVHSALEALNREAFPHVETLDPERAPHVLARHLAEVAERLLTALKRGTNAGDLQHLAEVERATLAALDAQAGEADRRPEEVPVKPLTLLREVVRAGDQPRPAPLIPLSESALRVNEPGEPSLGMQLQRELGSADRVDLLCAFNNWHGVRVADDTPPSRTRLHAKTWLFQR